MTYTFFCFIYLCLIFYMFIEAESYTPVGRLAHSSALVGNKIYFFGGVYQKDGKNIISDEVFYLDLAKSFKVTSPPFVDLASSSIPFGSAWAAVALDNVKDDPSIYLFGGIMLDVYTYLGSFDSFMYKFNINSSSWSVPSISKFIRDHKRREMKVAIDDFGNFYIFGGSTDRIMGSPTIHLFNDMVVGSEFSWITTYSINAPTRRISYSATLLSNGIIVYIGGYEINENEKGQNVNISQINLYNTTSSTWSVNTASVQDQIDDRVGHTAVLAPNGDQIIVFGGVNNNFFRAEKNVAVLDTGKEPFEWTAPNVYSTTNEYPALVFHTANIFGNYMIVAFGNTTQVSALSKEQSSRIYVMDIRNYTWVDSVGYKPLKPPEETLSITSRNDDNKLVPIFAIIATSISLLIQFN